MKKLLTSSLVLLMILLFAPLALATTPQVYVAKLSEDATNITAYVIENTLGTVTYSRIEEGRYRMTCTGCFPDESKIVGLRSFHFVPGGKYYVYWEDEVEPLGDSLVIQTYNNNGALSDNILSVNDFRIEVYSP